MATRIESVRSVFDNPDWYFSRRAHDIRIRVETVRELTSLRKYSRILDIGCGDGSLSLQLLKEGTHVTALDISSTMLSIVRSKVQSADQGKLETVNQDFMEAEFAPRSFDLILCVGLMVHIESPVAFIEKMVSLLEPGGGIIVECSDAGHFVTRMLNPVYRFKTLFRPSSPYKLTQVRYAEIESCMRRLQMYPEATFRYSAPPPGVHRIFSQQTLYKTNRRLFGTLHANRNKWLGNEYLTLFSARLGVGH